MAPNRGDTIRMKLPMHPVNGKRPIVELVMLQNGKYQPIKFSNNVQVRMHKPYFNELVFQIKFTLSFISTCSEYREPAYCSELLLIRVIREVVVQCTYVLFKPI